jgi:outer membrane protein OmpA-like peptidoglycan-associated protein
MMKASKKRISALFGFLLLAVLSLANAVGYAQDETVKVDGVIKARSGATMILETKEDPNLAVELTEATRVGQVQGVLKARQKAMSMAALIPGLPVKVEGFHNLQKQLVATSVKFKGNDLEQARAIQAGMHETNVATAENQAELAKQKEALAEQGGQLTEQQQKIADNKAQIAANKARFGQLDDYYIMDQVTILFANGSSKIDPKYNSELQLLGSKAKGVHGYMIEVKGYASATGSVSANQAISAKSAPTMLPATCCSNAIFL